MEIIRDPKTVYRRVISFKKEGKRIGFVPTMGYLHEGHLSLIRIARTLSDILVVSIFVNPIQFGPNEDYNIYPRDPKRDAELCKKEGVNILFIPEVDDMYPQNYSTYVDVLHLSDHLCGKSRPGHFRGVATVCTKLFNITQPDITVFGQKDAQQAFIIKRLIRDLNFNIELIIAPIVREPDGLAMSSRNIYLTPEERKEAIALYKSLCLAQELVLEKGVRKSSEVIKGMEELIKTIAKHGTIDYISIVDTKELHPIEELKGEILIALAVKFSKARLIDNIIVKLSE